MATNKKITHEEGMTFLSALITLIYNFVKSFKRNKNANENVNPNK